MSAQAMFLHASEREAALVLAGTYSVQIHAPEEEAHALEVAGFVEAPIAIECFMKTAVDLASYPRRYRKKLRLSLEEWERLGLTMQLTTVSAFGRERFFEAIYFPIFLGSMYGKGIAPHFVNELAPMTALVDAGLTLAVITSRDGAIVGAAILRPGIVDESVHVVKGQAPTGEWEEGLVYALIDEFAACRRALVVELARKMNEAGRPWLSLGRDLVYCDEGYDGVFFEKMHVADSVVACFGKERALYAWSTFDSSSFMFFAWDRMARVIRPKNYGCAEDRFLAIASVFEERPSS